MSLKLPEWPFGSRMMTIGAAGLKYLKMAPKQVIRIAALDRLEICAHTYTRGPYILYLSIYVLYTLYIFCYIIFTVQRQTLIRFDPLKLPKSPIFIDPPKTSFSSQATCWPWRYPHRPACADGCQFHLGTPQSCATQVRLSL
jgi:hypothetical protein